jgi:mono/diheme cytochrome c family protein
VRYTRGDEEVDVRWVWGVAVGALLAACGSGDGGGGGGDVAAGGQLFDANCAVCHGEAGTGTTAGPPLVHEIYEPGHHPDGSFVAAVRQGVQPHHWEFGAMPPVPGLDDDEVAAIIAYVRDLQREAGITG